MQRIVGVICLLVVVLASGLAGADSSATDTAMQKARSLKGNLSSSSGINSWLFGPATSDDTKFKTFDLGKEFEAKVMCQGEAPVVTVTAFPNGNITSVGELNFRVDYDLNLDGEVEGTTYINQVAGACANGAVFGCDPGTWKNCSYAQLQIKDGQIVPVSEFTGSEAGTSIPRGPHGLKGCFCFNAACGSPVLSMLEQILSNIGMGFVDLIRQRNQGVAITKTDYNMGEMKLSFIGAKATNCAGLGTEAEVQGLTALQDQVDFPVQNALDNQPEGSAYKALEASFENDARQFYSCTINSTVSSEIKESVRKVLTKFGIGWDADGSSKQCYYFSEGGCGSYFGEPGSWQGCLDQVVPTGLHKICSDLHVSGGYFTEITNVSHYKETSGLFATESIGFGCYGGGESCCDNSDQWWEMLCWGKRLDDSFVCHSPSMGAAGEVIHNDPYFENKYQGCETIYYYENKCAALEKREDCHLVQEKTDGVFTIKDGQLTGVSTPTSCRTFKGAYRSISVCEPWWTRERLYECSPLDVNFNKERQRVQHITQSVDYDKTTGTWGTQGDMLFNGDTSITKIFDANIQFDTNFENCMPGCVVAAETVNTGIYLPGQGKLAADGHYHVPEKVEQTYVAGGGPKTVLKTVNCVKNETTGAYSCPVDTAAGEEARTDCLCVDNDQFAQVVAQLMSVDQAGKDVICSTGENIGMCSAEDAGAVKRVICGDFKMGEDGQVIIDETTIWDCLPKLWKGPAIRQQYHEVWANDEYKCMAKIPAYPEDDHFDNYIGTLSPVSAWFDPAVDWAKPLIIQTLESDPDFIPDPGPDCPCGGLDSQTDPCTESNGQWVCGLTAAKFTSQELCEEACGNGIVTFTTNADGTKNYCTWTVATSVDNINRRDVLSLRADNQDPFGDVFLEFSSSGSWGGTHAATCTKVEDASTYTVIEPNNTCVQKSDMPYAMAVPVMQGSECNCSWVDPTNYPTSTVGGVNFTVDLKSLAGGVIPSGGITCVAKARIYPQYSNRAAMGRFKFSQGGTANYSSIFQTGTGKSLNITYTQKFTKEQLDISSILRVDYMVRNAYRACNPAYIVTSNDSLVCTGEGIIDTEWKYENYPENIILNTAPSSSGSIDFTLALPDLPDDATNFNLRLYGKHYPSILSDRRSTIVSFKVTAPNGDTMETTKYFVGYGKTYEGYLSLVGIPRSYLGSGNTVNITAYAYEVTDRVSPAPVVSEYLKSMQYSYIATGSGAAGWFCNSNLQSFSTQTECVAGCKEPTMYKCNITGEIVSDPALCPAYQCPKTGIVYSTEEECSQNCLESFSCNASSDDYQFKVTIRNPGTNIYSQELDLTAPSEKAKHIASAGYEHKNLILMQCVDKYTQPYLKFDDPDNRHFEFSWSDALIYQYSAERNELPRDNTSGIPYSLPLYPPTYRGTTTASGVASTDNSEASNLSTVPNTPMFWDKVFTASFTDDLSQKLGNYSLGMTPGSPYVYYYECPDGNTVKSTTNNCGAVDPFGGVDSTVDGTWCFQRRCDAQAVMEPEGVLSGCGMANDGEWN